MAGAAARALVLLLCLPVGPVHCALAFTEEPGDRVHKPDGYCSWITRAHGARKELYSEFRLRVEGEPENYQPASTYRGTGIIIIIIIITPAISQNAATCSVCDPWTQTQSYTLASSCSDFSLQLVRIDATAVGSGSTGGGLQDPLIIQIIIKDIIKNVTI